MKQTPADIAMAKGIKCQRCKGTKFHMWTSPQYTEHVSCDKCGYAVEVMPQSFVQWWKNHRESGYAEKGDQHRWLIPPPTAWNCHRFRLEFSDATGHYYDPVEYRFRGGQRDEWPIYSDEDRKKWSQDQDETESMTVILEERFGKEFWVHMTAQELIANAKMIAREILEKGGKANWTAQSMKAKMNKAYAYEPGQSEEETELLRRRRE